MREKYYLVQIESERFSHNIGGFEPTYISDSRMFNYFGGAKKFAYKASAEKYMKRFEEHLAKSYTLKLVEWNRNKRTLDNAS